MEHKTTEELEKMSTPRLLNYYKSIRAKTNAFTSGKYYDDFNTEEEYENAKQYLYEVKCLLDNRENLKK